MNEVKPLLVCDFDGTLVQRDSELEMVNYFRRTGKLGVLQYAAAGLALIPNAICTRLEKPRLVRAWCAFHSPARQQSLIEDFLQNGAGELKVDPAVLEVVKGFDGEKLLLTGSDERMVRGLLYKFGLEGLFDAVIGAKVSAHGLRLLRHPYGKDKLRQIPRHCAVGIGDSVPDRHFLMQCDRAYTVARRPEMVALAKQNGWQILKSVSDTEE